jgi:hypothetical protein
MGVDVLERTCELVIEPLDEGCHASGDLEDLLIGKGRELLVILPLLCVLNNNDVPVVLENLEQLGEVLLSPG